MSPAIDASVALDAAPKGGGEIFKNVKTRENAGGKAINVARWLAIRGLREAELANQDGLREAELANQDKGGESGGYLESRARPRVAPAARCPESRPPCRVAPAARCPESRAQPRVICAGLLGEDNAALFEKEFAKYGIVDKMTRVKGATRRNEMITWPAPGKADPPAVAGKPGEVREMRSFKLNQAAFEGVELDEDGFLEEVMERTTVEAVAAETASVRQQETASVRQQEEITSTVQPSTFNLQPSLQPSTSDLQPPLVVILSGSLPKCCGDGFYAKAVAAFKQQGAFVVLDASGEAMARALRGGPLGDQPSSIGGGPIGERPLSASFTGSAATGPLPASATVLTRPDLIKPNDEECEALVGFVPKTPEEFKKATAMLRGEIETAKGERLLGAEHVVISAGGEGAWFDGEFVAAPKVDVVDTTAAGDTLLAEYCWRLRGAEAANQDKGGAKREALLRGSRAKRAPKGCASSREAANQDIAPRFAVAAGSAACTMPGSNPPPVELVEELANVNSAEDFS